MDFVFAFGNLPLFLTDRLGKALASIWGEVCEIREPFFYLCYPRSHATHYLVHGDGYIGCIDGWAGIHGPSDWAGALSRFFSAVRYQWPLTDEAVTGNFAGLLYDRDSNSLRVFSALVGIFPLYYSAFPSHVVGGTSLVALGRAILPEIDVIGLVQRASPPHYMNYGRRTLLKGVWRLMPGEMQVYDSELRVTIMWDNNLYTQETRKASAQAALDLWNTIMADVALSVAPYKHVCVGMSGGWDSRLVAGALRETGKGLTCLTYGTSEDQYEVKLARRCSEILGANFVFCDVYESYFPKREDFVQNMLRGEGTDHTPWFSVLAKASRDDRMPIVLGDLFQMASGQELAALSPRMLKWRWLFGLLGTDSARAAGSPRTFRQWADRVLDSVLGLQMKQVRFLSPRMLQGYAESDIADQLADDLHSALGRIAAYNPPYAILYDELFHCHVHRQNKQILCLKQEYTPIPAMMGVRTIRATALIDPVDRAGKKLLHEIQRLPTFSQLSALPSAAIPFVPSLSPLWLKRLVWGLRWFMDRELTKRALVNRDPTARLRLLKSLDLVKLYNHPEAIERVESWFAGGIFQDHQQFVERVRSRAHLDTWPVISTDVVGAASSSILVDLVYAGSLLPPPLFSPRRGS